MSNSSGLTTGPNDTRLRLTLNGASDFRFRLVVGATAHNVHDVIHHCSKHVHESLLKIEGILQAKTRNTATANNKSKFKTQAQIVSELLYSSTKN